jgi:class 3 adenylate cyclase/predicted ATPase
MTFDEVLAQIIDLLKRQGRVSYGALKRRYALDEAYLEDLKGEILYVHESDVQADERGFTWVGEQITAPLQTSQQPEAQATQPPQPEPLPTEPRPREAERRQLTVMFCDLVDSTKLSSQLDPEDYREVVREHQKVCSEVIQRYDGHIAQYLGDGLLVYFGYPQSHEDEAQRAVYTGLGILNTLKQLNARLERDKDIRLALRIGIHTGLVVVGDIGEGSHREQLALGETPNVAARIQGLAEPGTVVISEATYRLIQGYFDCQNLGEQTLRGVAQPLRVYQVLQESGVQSRLDVASTRGLTPLVGREQEVGLLLERWEQAKDGQGQVILLSGEAGIGKSRLVQVLKDHLADEPHSRWECRSSPYYQNTALYPIIDLIQRTLRWQQDDTQEKKLERLERQLSQYRLPLVESVPLFAPLLSLSIPEERYPPLHFSPQRQRQKTLESIVAILSELAEQQPVLFILEDLHWTDPTTLALLSLLVEQVPTTSLCALLSCRPHFQPSWHHRSYLTEITVNRLSRNQIERMAQHVAGGKTLPVEIIQQLVEKTDGVPLFVEEMTKAVLESGVVKDMNSQYALAGSVATLAIPATLQDSLMARLDRLITAKGLAQQAAVIGRQFSYALLQAVSQLDDPTLQRELNRLVEAELVHQRELPPQATYLFKHALVVDAAYASLLKSTRQQYHQRIAQILEEQFPETTATQPELLAYHYTEAGLNAQAVGYWQKAGEHSIQHSAYVEAISHLTKGLEVLQTPPAVPTRIHQELGLQILLGQALIVTKGQAASEVGDAYHRAQELCQWVEDASQRFRVLYGLWHFHVVRAELQTVRALSEELLSLAPAIQEPGYLLCAHWTLGGAWFLQGGFATARAQWEQSNVLYTSQHHHTVTSLFGVDLGVFSLCWLPHALWHLGYHDQAIALSQRALNLAHDVLHSFSVAVALAYAMMLRQFCRDDDTVDVYADEGLVLCAEQGFTYYLAWGTILRGWSLSAQGQGEAGLSLMRRGLADLRATGGEVRLPYYLALMAEVCGKTHHVAEGLTLVAEALTLVEKTDERWYEAELHRLKGALLLQQSSDNSVEAESCFHQAITIAQSQQAKSWELRAATSLAKLWQHQGKRQEAYALLAPVYNWFTEGFDTADLKDAKTLLDELA